MKIEDLIGSAFIHESSEDITFFISKSEDGICTIKWDKYTGGEEGTTYRDEEVLDYINRGRWILV